MLKRKDVNLSSQAMTFSNNMYISKRNSTAVEPMVGNAGYRKRVALTKEDREKLDEWITMIKKELEDYKANNPNEMVAPFAVNQICHHSNNRLEHDMEVCVKHEVPIIITSLRAPKFVVDSVH